MFFRRMIWIIFLYVSICLAQSPKKLSSYNNLHSLSSVPETKFHFAILGDRTGGNQESWNVFDRSIFEINQLRPDFVLMLGDLIEGGNGNTGIQWEEARRHLDSLQMPLFMIPGNHDISSKESALFWKQSIGSTYFSFSYRSCHFLALDTQGSTLTGEDGFGVKQLAFIEQDISRNRQAEQFFIFLHHPVWLQSGKLKTQWGQIESMLQGVRYSVFAGHLHTLAESRINGRRYLVLGPTGGKLRIARNPSLGQFQHFTWVTVEKDTSYLGFIEPGKMYSEKTAIDAFDHYLQGMFLLRGKTP